MAEALRHWERTTHSQKKQCLLLNPLILLVMKKLKAFTVKNMSSLSREEMALINGGEFYSFTCYFEGQSCAVKVSGGINTGTCKWYYTSPNTQVLTCIIGLHYFLIKNLILRGRRFYSHDLNYDLF